MTTTQAIRYELWDYPVVPGCDSLLKTILVTSTSDADLADTRAIAAAKQHAKDMGYRDSLVLYRAADNTIAWER